MTTIRSAALARNQYWTAAAWLLERKYPDEYGKADRRQDEDEGGDVPRIVLGVVAKPVQKRIDFSTVGDNGGAEGSDASAADGGGVHEDGSSRSASSSSAASAPSPEGGAA